jgi:hypothetical protein
MNDPVPESRGRKMLEVLIPVLLIGGWIAVQVFVLPRYGVGL